MPFDHAHWPPARLTTLRSTIILNNGQSIPFDHFLFDQCAAWTPLPTRSDLTTTLFDHHPV
jgi:hypothetical protein